MKNKLNISFVLIFLGAALWGTAGIFVRTAEELGLKEMQMVLFRALFTVIILGIFLLLKNKSLLRVRLKDLWLFLAAGIMSIVLFNFCYYKTMSLTSLSVSAVLLYTAPFFVVFMSPFVFGQAITFRKISACLTAFIGCIFVTGAIGNGNAISPKALIFGILTGFGYSLYTVFSRILLGRGYSSYTITFYTFLFALMGCIPLTDIRGSVALSLNKPEVALVGLLMAVFNTVIPYLLYTEGLKGVDPSIAPIIAMVEPVVATVVGIAVYSEAITVLGVFGIFLVFFSVAVLNMKDKKMKIKANAKINLSLSVLGKRDDGYHEMDTVMQSVSLFDTVYLKKAPEISVKCGKMSDESNIAFKAAKLFFEETNLNGGVKIKIKKRIPEAAGLGGGSTDAAAVLVGLDRLYNTNLDYQTLLDLAVKLGADVPFLIKGGTARARGIGEILEPLNSVGALNIVIAKGDNKPSTGEMFKRLDSIDYIKPDIDSCTKKLNSNNMFETFENSFYALWQNTELEKILKQTNPQRVSLSGSGPSFFAIFSNKATAKKVLKSLKKENISCYLCEAVDKSLIFE